MAIQLSVAVRNARLDAIESTTGASAVLRVFNNAAGTPANCAAASTGVQLASATLPADWMAAAASGSKALSGTWQDASVDATGTALYFRIFDSTGTTCHVQGSVGTSGTDMIVDSTSFTAGTQFTVTAFTLTDGNA